MEVGRSYLFHVKRHGYKPLLAYQGKYLGKDLDDLLFANLENGGVVIRVAQERLAKDTPPVELGADTIDVPLGGGGTVG